MKNNWEYKTIGDVCFITDYVSNGSFASLRENVQYIDTKDYAILVRLADYTNCFDKNKFVYINKESYDFLAKSSLKPGDIIMSNVGSLGKLFICPDLGQPMSIAPNSILIRTDNNKYYYYYFQSSYFQGEIKKISSTTALPKFNKTQFKKIDIKIPPLSTQQSIVSELDSLSKIIADCKETLKDYDALEQSIFYDMFGDPVKNDKGWDVKKLGEIGNLARGVSKHRPRNAPELLGGTMPLIQTGDVANADFFIEKYTNTYSELGVAQSKVWKKGTLCITIAATIGKCAILNFDACFPDSVVGFEPNNEISEKIYILFLFKNLQKILEEEAPAVAQKNINLALLNNLTVPLPPLSLQQQFASKIEAIEEMKVETKKALQEAETLFQARMDYWFN